MDPNQSFHPGYPREQGGDPSKFSVPPTQQGPTTRGPFKPGNMNMPGATTNFSLRDSNFPNQDNSQSSSGLSANSNPPNVAQHPFPFSGPIYPYYQIPYQNFRYYTRPPSNLGPFFPNSPSQPPFGSYPEEMSHLQSGTADFKTFGLYGGPTEHNITPNVKQQPNAVQKQTSSTDQDLGNRS